MTSLPWGFQGGCGELRIDGSHLLLLCNGVRNPDKKMYNWVLLPEMLFPRPRYGPEDKPKRTKSSLMGRDATGWSAGVRT